MAAWDLTTYTGLKDTLADSLNRTDLTTAIVGFIQLCEASMRRRLRITTTRANLTISAASTALPAGARELRSIKLTTSDASLDYPVDIVTYEEYARVKAENNATGRPRC